MREALRADGGTYNMSVTDHKHGKAAQVGETSVKQVKLVSGRSDHEAIC